MTRLRRLWRWYVLPRLACRLGGHRIVERPYWRYVYRWCSRCYRTEIEEA